MKVVFTKHLTILETHLKDAVRTSELKIERTIFRSFALKRYKGFRVWDTIAKINVSKQTIFVSEDIWKEYELLIKRLSDIVGLYAKPILIIEVRS